MIFQSKVLANTYTPRNKAFKMVYVKSRSYISSAKVWKWDKSFCLDSPVIICYIIAKLQYYFSYLI